MPDILHATTLLFIRHGHARSEDGSYDEHTPLSDLGHKQAEETARYLITNSFPTAIFSSPFPRAMQTAQPLCQQLSMEANLDPRLAEFEMAPQKAGEVELQPDPLWRPEHRGMDNGESLSEFSARVWAVCEEIVEQHYGMLVAVFAHSGTIEAAIRWSLGIPPDSPWQHEFALGNASITEITFWPKGRFKEGSPRYALLHRLGDSMHLGELKSDT